MLSGPEALEELRSWRSFSMKSATISSGSMSGTVCCKSGRLDVFSLVKTDLKKELRIFAFPTWSETVSVPFFNGWTPTLSVRFDLTYFQNFLGFCWRYWRCIAGELYWDCFASTFEKVWNLGRICSPLFVVEALNFSTLATERLNGRLNLVENLDGIYFSVSVLRVSLRQDPVFIHRFMRHFLKKFFTQNFQIFSKIFKLPFFVQEEFAANWFGGGTACVNEDLNHTIMVTNAR